MRISDLTGRKPKVTFPDTRTCVADRVSLTLQDVQFIYPEQSQQALKRIFLRVNAGEHMAILGRIGCGESTLLQQLTRAQDPQQGETLPNDSPVVSLDEVALRQTISVVPQQAHLFSATLRDNLLLVSPGSSDEAPSEILHHVGLEKLLEDAGLNSWLDGGGYQLSGDESRRLAIARALLYDTSLVLLDEPTEGLDATTESQIPELFTEMMLEETVLVITYRLHGFSHF